MNNKKPEQFLSINGYNLGPEYRNLPWDIHCPCDEDGDQILWGGSELPKEGQPYVRVLIPSNVDAGDAQRLLIKMAMALTDFLEGADKVGDVRLVPEFRPRNGTKNERLTLMKIDEELKREWGGNYERVADLLDETDFRNAEKRLRDWGELGSCPNVPWPGFGWMCELAH